MAIPKLALIPSTQGTSLYSVLPANGVGDFTFTRAGSATRINSQGLIETVASGVSRLNYPLIDGVVNGCPSHLLEPTKSNSFSYSEPIANSGSASGISYESFIWSLGFTNCVKLGDNSAVRFRYGGSVLASTQYTVSAFVIMDDLSEPLVGSGYSVGDFSFVVGGAVGGVVNSNVYYGNNIYRVSTTLTPGSNLGNNGVIKYTTQSSKGFRITGFQAEVGSYPTSYIPTNGSAVTRSAETANGSGDASTFNYSEGVLMVEINFENIDTVSKYLGLHGSTSANRVIIGLSANSSTLVGFVIANGSNVFNPNFELGASVNTNNKIALKYKENDFALWVNGIEVVIDNLGSLSAMSINELAFFGYQTNNQPFLGSTKQLQYFDSALNDTELETLTSWISFTDMANGQLYTIE